MPQTPIPKTIGNAPMVCSCVLGNVVAGYWVMLLMAFGFANYYATKNVNASEAHLPWTAIAVAIVAAPFATAFELHKRFLATPLCLILTPHIFLAAPLRRFLSTYVYTKFSSQLICA